MSTTTTTVTTTTTDEVTGWAMTAADARLLAVALLQAAQIADAPGSEEDWGVQGAPVMLYRGADDENLYVMTPDEGLISMVEACELNH